MAFHSKKITKAADSQKPVQLNELDPASASASVKAAPKEPDEVAGLKATPSLPGAPDDYAVKEHLNHIVQAHKIMSDPVKMAAVHKAITGHVQSFNNLQDLRNYAQKTRNAAAGSQEKVASTGPSSLPDDGE